MQKLSAAIRTRGAHSSWATLGQVRRAGVFARTRDQRQAIARLERSIIDRIETDFDKSGADAAWSYASSQSAGIQHLQSEAARLEGVLSPDSVARRFDSQYREYLQRAASLLEPGKTRRFVVECASAKWRTLYSDIVSGAAE